MQRNRYFLHLGYHGANYHGWQIQPNAPSVQETINQCLTTLLGEQIYVVGAGRTDTGVHAREMFAHFDISKPVLIKEFAHRMNKFLPPDIVIYGLYLVDSETHARFDASFRTYEYLISKGKNPFLRGLAWQSYTRLDVAKMNQACGLLFEFEDFSSFAKIHTDVKTHICKILLAEWQEAADRYIFTVRADRFLRNMVRAMVGTLVEVGKGKITLNDFREILRAEDRSKAAASAPAEGLYLTEVVYPKNVIDVKR